jgi:hypothetical protein
MNKNKFNNDKERILELKITLEMVLSIMNNEKDLDTAYSKSRTLIQDTLSRFKQDNKFVTAEAKIEKINGITFEFIKD